MTRRVITAGVEIPRRHIIKLGQQERADLARDASIVLRRPVDFPVPGREPHFEEAYVDPGGTEIWGPGPYLKVPNGPASGDHVPVNRVFCPWGYAGEQVRIARSRVRLVIESVSLERKEPERWEWLIRCTPTENVRTTPSSSGRAGHSTGRQPRRAPGRTTMK